MRQAHTSRRLSNPPSQCRSNPENGSLPECTLNLMPFSIKYTGTAPVSTYFRPKPVQGDPTTNVAGGSQEGTSQLSTATDATNTVEQNVDSTLDATPKENPLVAAFQDEPSVGGEYLSQMSTPESHLWEQRPTRSRKLLRQAVDHPDVHGVPYTSVRMSSHRL